MAHLAARHASHAGMDMDMGSASTTMAGMKMYFHATIPSTDYLWFQSWVPSGVGAVIGASIGIFLLAVGERLLVALQRGAAVYWRRDALRRLTSSDPTSSSAKPSLPVSSSDASPAYRASPASSTLEKRLPRGAEDGEEIVPVRSSSETDSLPSTGTVPHLTAANTRSPAPPTPATSYLPRSIVHALTSPTRRDRYSIPFVWQNDLARGCVMFLTKGLGYLLMLVVMTFNLWFITAACLGAGVGEALFGRHGYLH